MAKSPNHSPVSPAYLGSEEESQEEESSSEEEGNATGSESESESEPESKKTDNAKPNKKPPSTPALPAKIPAAQTAETSSEDEESGSESDSPDPKPDPTIKPIVSKPVDDPQKVVGLKKPRSKLNKASVSSPLKSDFAAGSKRPSSPDTGADGEEKKSKRSKKALEKDFDESEKKNKQFQRLWSEADELALLKGMADFSAKNKIDPAANIYSFHDFIKTFIHVDVSKTQLQDKIRRLRKKYESNAGKGKQVKRKNLSDHEQKAFELSKAVWGNETSSAGGKNRIQKLNGDAVISGPSKNANAKTPLIVEVAEGDKGVTNSGGSKSFDRLKSVNWSAKKLGAEEWIMENSMQLVVGEKRAKMDEKWKKFRMEEAEMYANKLELMLEEAKLVLNVLKSAGN